MKELRVRKGRWFRLWLSMKDNERKALELWLKVNNKNELLNALKILKQYIGERKNTNVSEGKILKSAYPQLANPYQIVYKLYNETLFVVLFKNLSNTRDSVPKLLVRIAGCSLLAHKGMIKDSFALITQIAKESMFMNLTYVGILAMTLKSFLYSDFSTENLMDNDEVLDLFQYITELHDMNLNIVKSMLARGILNRIYNSKTDACSKNRVLDVVMTHINKIAQYIETKEYLDNKYPLFSFVLLMSMFDMFFYLLHDLRKAFYYLKRAEPLSKSYNVNSAYPHARTVWAIRLARIAIKTGNHELLEHSIRVMDEKKSQRQKQGIEHLNSMYKLLFEAYMNILNGNYNQALVSIKRGINYICEINNDLMNSSVVKQLLSDLLLIEVYTYIKLRSLSTAYELICSVNSYPYFLANKFPFKQATIFMKAIIAKQSSRLSVSKVLKELNEAFGETFSKARLHLIFEDPSYKNVAEALREAISNYPELIEVMELSNPLTLLFDVPEVFAREWYASCLLGELQSFG